MIERIQKQFTIPREYHNQRIDSVLAQLLPEYSRSQISGWIKTGEIKINSKPCRPKDKSVGGDVIDMHVDFTADIDPDFKLSQPEDIPLQVIYEDEEVLVINKPAGLVVHPGAGNREHTLVNALLHYNPNLHHIPRAGIIHRLDKDTTGLLIIAKTLTAHTSLIRQMQARDIERHYLTLVQGYVVSGGIIDTGFSRHSRNRLKMTVTEQGRQAITHYAVCKHYEDFTLLDVNLMTGRTHQIRVHMEYINHPVFGDQLYGGRMRLPPGMDESSRAILQQFKRQALHARTICFYHPQSDEQIRCEAPIPDDFQLLIDTLDAHDEREEC